MGNKFVKKERKVKFIKCCLCFSKRPFFFFYFETHFYFYFLGLGLSPATKPALVRGCCCCCCC